MKTDVYTKTVLTVIAVCLVVIVFRDADLIPKAYAVSPGAIMPPDPAVKYGIVPINPDGSVNVKIVDKLDVNIVGINTWDELDVNIDEVGGLGVQNHQVPVAIAK